VWSGGGRAGNLHSKFIADSPTRAGRTNLDGSGVRPARGVSRRISDRDRAQHHVSFGGARVSPTDGTQRMELRSFAGGRAKRRLAAPGGAPGKH
jgi:hypothetical protein